MMPVEIFPKAFDPLLAVIRATDQKSTLHAAVNDCSAMLVQADIDNDNERTDHQRDTRRIARYRARRDALVQHRKRLESLYVSLYNENPWANVPY